MNGYSLAPTLEAARANCAEARRRYETSTGIKRARAFDDLKRFEAQAATLRLDVALNTLREIAGKPTPVGEIGGVMAALSRETLERVAA